MGKEQELLARAKACLELGERTGSRGNAPTNVYNVLAELIDDLARRSSSDEQAEVVAWRWRYDDPSYPGRTLGWFYGPVEPPPDAIGRAWSGWKCEPLASPSGVKAGVTEEMVTRGCEEADWLVDPAAWKSDPIEAERITSAYRSGMRAILSAALGGDEGMGEGWQHIETAPKGEPVLLYEPEVQSGRSVLPARCVVERFPTTYPRAATHWRVLPTPPIQGDGK